MKPHRSIAPTLAITFVALSTQSLRADDWPAYQHDNAHTGFTTASPNPADLKLQWSAPAGYATPIIVGNSIIATKNAGGTGGPTIISSFQLDTGAINWSYPGNFLLASLAAYGNGLVVFTGGEIGPTANTLCVLDAVTGTLKYTVPSLANAALSMPVLVKEANGSTTAYIASNGSLRAVALGATSGTQLWSAGGSFGGQSIPTIVGNTIILAGPGQYYAIDRATGAVNHFNASNISGGGGDTVVYDAARGQFYVLDTYSSAITGITAYHFGGSYNSITQLWQYTGAGVYGGGQVAIGPSGLVYSLDNSTLIELDPSTGKVLRSKSGLSISNAIAPLIAGNTLWAYNDSNTLAFDLSTLTLVATLPGSRGSLNSTFDGPGAVDNSHFALDDNTIFDHHGFDVYATPEPPTLSLFLLSVLPLTLRRRRAN